MSVKEKKMKFGVVTDLIDGSTAKVRFEVMVVHFTGKTIAKASNLLCHIENGDIFSVNEKVFIKSSKKISKNKSHVLRKIL